MRARRADGRYCPFLGVARQPGSPEESKAGRELAETSQQHRTIKLNIGIEAVWVFVFVEEGVGVCGRWTEMCHGEHE